MTPASPTRPALSASDLAELLARGERVTVLDVRGAPGATIASARSRHVPAHTLLANPGAVAAELDGPVAVVCNRGVVAESVTRALVVDPAPDAAHYVALAGELGATITDVVDTHLHADHLSGARTLARAAGAT